MRAPPRASRARRRLSCTHCCRVLLWAPVTVPRHRSLHHSCAAPRALSQAPRPQPVQPTQCRSAAATCATQHARLGTTQHARLGQTSREATQHGVALARGVSF